MTENTDEDRKPILPISNNKSIIDNKPTAFIDDDPDSIDSIIESINDDKSILVLGPVFSVDQNNNKINEILQKYFESTPPKMDHEFQNLFIKKEPFNELDLATKIRRQYQRIMAGTLTDNIAAIPFSATISFTQDLYLVNSYVRTEQEFTFQYFSRSEPSFESLKKYQKYKSPDSPFLFNLYGNYEDFNSLITNYDAFYDFLFSILGGTKINIFPPELSKKIESASTFLFLGFDLKKWYVPLLISKLIRQSGRFVKYVASLSDTDQESNEEYIQWLNRYPLQLQFVRDTASFITTILGKELKAPKKITKEQAIERWQDDAEYVGIKNKWTNDLGGIDDQLMPVLNEISSFFEKKQYPDSFRFFNQQKAYYSTSFDRKRRGAMSIEDFHVAVANIRDASVGYLQEN